MGGLDGVEGVAERGGEYGGFGDGRFGIRSGLVQETPGQQGSPTGPRGSKGIWAGAAHPAGRVMGVSERAFSAAAALGRNQTWHA